MLHKKIESYWSKFSHIPSQVISSSHHLGDDTIHFLTERKQFTFTALGVRSVGKHRNMTMDSVLDLQRPLRILKNILSLNIKQKSFTNKIVKPYLNLNQM